VGVPGSHSRVRWGCVVPTAYAKVDESERCQGGGRERRKAVDYEHDAGESRRSRCPSRQVTRKERKSLLRERGRREGAHRPSEMRSTGREAR
jgi:hypothetical protein